MGSLPDENTWRFTAVLNRKIETGKLMNALGHMTVGLAGGYENPEKMCFLQYKDKDSGIHPNISHFPFIVLSANNSNQIRNIRIATLNSGIKFTDFTSTMTVGTSQEQMDTTNSTYETDLEYYGICMFGRTDEIKEITKKFSLFR
ncbi:hypothetical protein A2982_03510 [candidate division WWE3 bacterium RIFCSPLOWO2_01_FULL_39_13]|uniref:DUF2000 domain-containing protein n=1 Tax=candidate division WWE3 bacterium RIFCSPLOWO2_01_FULL_39_13 TaxID=1802624 RepID=A0A1F4V3F2_UNCKA|nr:MAG: hypothetical protein A2982_03510 [candidate division WWE3 bacterium RIFCSPLOWO2_01_FULL_39_13]